MSSVQFNLLPPSKYDAMQSEASEAVIVRKAMLVAAACAALFVLLLGYTEGVQRAQINSATSSVNTKAAKLKNVANIEAILTIQNQLSAAANLHQSQHDMSRIFTYLSKLTPPNASVGTISVDSATASIKIDGTAQTAADVNAFIDTLKYTQYKVGSSAAAPAFSSVVESNFSITETGVAYSISAKYDPKLFANNLTNADGKLIGPQLVVPSSTTTRAGDPGKLFGGGR
ncbi:MAG TPA: PilN domain-containing protein [Candidatus Saccharimonadales bacterium]|nr:PilN domain-containing protein [Candidatus Saccharimonadales bacterium]